MLQLPRSAEFIRLNEEIRKGRVSQFLTHTEVKELAKNISSIEGEELVRFILKQKSFFKRSIIDVYILMACIQKYSFFDDILEGKGEKALLEFCKHLYYTKLEKGKYLYEIGDIADKFYIVMTGTVIVQVAYKEQIVSDNGDVKIEQRMKQAMKYSKGEMFGETISKQSIARRAASILTETDCQFFQVKKKDYETVNKYMTISLMREKYMFFEQIDLFSRLYKSSLETMLYLTTPKQVHMGYTLYQEGQKLDELYLIKQGEFKLETTIFGKQNDSNPLTKLQIKSQSNFRKFETSIVGPKYILGEIDALMGIPTMESCTCITEKAYLYVVKKKDLLVHIQQNGSIEGYVASKYYLRNKRLKNLNKSYNQNNSLMSVFGYKRENTQEKSNRGRSHELHSKSLSKIANEQDDSLPLMRKNRVKESTIYTRHKRCNTEKQKSEEHKSLLNINEITQIIKQKKKYSKIRKNNNEPLFKFSNEIPIFLRVKMGVQSNTLKATEEKNDNSKTLTEFLSPKKLSQTMRPTRKYVKKEPKVSANSKTIYGKFFQLLLDL